MTNTTKRNEVIIFDGPESGMIYEFDGNQQMAVYEPDYERRIMIKNFNKQADLQEIQEAIQACEESYLEEVQ